MHPSLSEHGFYITNFKPLPDAECTLKQQSTNLIRIPHSPKYFSPHPGISFENFNSTEQKPESPAGSRKNLSRKTPQKLMSER